ncbi:MAG: hypothetical protein U0P45_13015 [Acidimicrobiales bacterium]
MVVSDRDPEVLEQAKDVLRRDGISLVLRLRLASTLHEVLMEMGAPDADELGATVAELARSGGDDPLVRRVALLDQVDVARLRHGPAELAQAAQALAADPPLDDARREAVRWRAVLDGLARAIDAGVEADDDLVQHAIAATQALLPADRMTPASRASLLLEAAHLARVVGAQEQALELARSAMAAAGLAALPPGEAPVPVAPDGFALRAWLLLSDVLTPVEGPAAALVAQRSAVEAARRIGAPGAVGWARRGVGHLQQRLERYDEAVVSYAEAARLLLEAGGTVEAAELMVNQARLELELDDLPRARATATSASDLLVGEWVRTDQPGAEEYRRRVLAPLRRDAFELVAIAAGAQDDHMEAVAWWRRSSDADIEAGGRGATYRSSGAEALGRAGDLDGAEAEYVEALLMARPAGQRDDDPNSLWQRGLIRHRRAVTRAEAGNTTGAAADAEVAIESFRSAGVPARAASSGWLLAQILVNGGRAAEAARANAIATQDLDASRDDDPHLRSRLADQRTRIAQALEG